MQTLHNIHDVCDVFCVLLRYVIRPLFTYTGSYISCTRGWRETEIICKWLDVIYTQNKLIINDNSWLYHPTLKS